MGGGAGDSEYGAPGESSDTVPQSQQRLLPCAELENSYVNRGCAAPRQGPEHNPLVGLCAVHSMSNDVCTRGL